MDLTTIVSMAFSSITGGAAVALFNKLKMDKKDAAQVSQSLIDSLFDQHEKLLNQVHDMNAEATEFRTKMVQYEAQIASYVQVVKELKHSIQEAEKENVRLTKLVGELRSELRKLEGKKP